MTRRKVILTASFVGLALATYFLMNFVYVRQQMLAVGTVGPGNVRIDFEIKAGEGVRSVAQRLEEVGLISSDWAFARYMQQMGYDKKMQAGHFQFLSVENGFGIAEDLLHGQAMQTKITFLEGWNAQEMDAYLAAGNFAQPGEHATDGAAEAAQKGLITAGEFTQLLKTGGVSATLPPLFAARPVTSLEGYFFPTTYFINPNNFTVKDLIERGVNEMQTQLAEVGMTSDHIEVFGKTRTLHELLTMASIVQLEERDGAQQKLVADILWRRLDSGMQLGADATLFYALGGHREFLTVDDLKINSPYNTRRFAGLPPTPVASPGASALAAAAHPEPNEFWYYLHGSDGTIHFATDLEGHNANKQKYLSEN